MLFGAGEFTDGGAGSPAGLNSVIGLDLAAGS
jgi:hypothetical protein